MKKKPEDILVDYFKDKFGALVGEALFNDELDKKGVENFEQLNLKQKIDFGSKVLDEVFIKFYSIDKIHNMKVFYLLRFSLNEAVEKLEKMINKQAEISISQLSSISLKDTDIVLNELKNENTVKFGFESSNLLEGLLMITISKELVVKFSSIMMEAMTGAKQTSNTIDEMKVSAVYEFFNIVLPPFLDVIGDAFDQAVYFTPLYYEEFKQKYFFNGEIILPKKIMKSTIEITINHEAIEGKMFFFIKQSMATFDNLVDQGESKQSAFEQSPPKILVKRSDNARTDMDDFFSQLAIPSKNIDYLLEKINKPTLFNFTFHDFTKFYDALMSDFCPNASKNKQETIKANLAYILKLD